MFSYIQVFTHPTRSACTFSNTSIKGFCEENANFILMFIRIPRIPLFFGEQHLQNTCINLVLTFFMFIIFVQIICLIDVFSPQTSLESFADLYAFLLGKTVFLLAFVHMIIFCSIQYFFRVPMHMMFSISNSCVSYRVSINILFLVFLLEPASWTQFRSKWFSSIHLRSAESHEIKFQWLKRDLSLDV